MSSNVVEVDGAEVVIVMHSDSDSDVIVIDNSHIALYHSTARTCMYI